MSQFGDEGEPIDAWRDTWYRARKTHKCHACGEQIEPGQRYHYTACVSAGAVDHWKRCERCQAIYIHLHDRIRKEGDDDEFCDPALNCGHEYEQRWEEKPPEWLAAMAFWRPGDPLPGTS